VVQLWEEYDRGIPSSPGQPWGPSIRVLDNRHRPQWRWLDTIKKPYLRCKFIWQEIVAASEDLGISPEQVAERIDRWRSLGSKSSISLNKLSDMILMSWKISSLSSGAQTISDYYNVYRNLIGKYTPKLNSHCITMHAMPMSKSCTGDAAKKSIECHWCHRLWLELLQLPPECEPEK